MVLALIWHSGNKFKDDLLGWRKLSLAFASFNGIPFRFEPLRALPFIIPSYMPEEIQDIAAVTQNPYLVPDWCWLGGYIDNISTPASETSDTFVHGDMGSRCPMFFEIGTKAVSNAVYLLPSAQAI